MYSNLSKEELSAIAKHGMTFLNLLFDNAHNLGGMDVEFCEWTQADWDKVRYWEKHLKQSFLVMLDDIKYDLQPAVQADCAHEWVSADNEVVTGGEICAKCHAIRATA